ncbi:MAG: TraR/DksA family transcriptional regulator [Oligoflexia bacterium]|nr:TraR/DksA family transcriptional regulator [Oligoflexia bacterium]
MNKEFLEEIKSELIAKKNEVMTRLEAIDKSKKRKEPLNADWSEQAVEMENFEVVDALDDMESIELEKIEGALKLIEAGNYGVCSNCSESIGEKRLKAIPTANLCIQCSQ